MSTAYTKVVLFSSWVDLITFIPQLKRCTHTENQIILYFDVSNVIGGDIPCLIFLKKKDILSHYKG
jgi:hypothetical protein